MEAVLEQYWEALDKVCREAQKHEAANIARIGAMIAERIQEGKSLWSFGCTHSALLVGETVYRAGAWSCATPSRAGIVARRDSGYQDLAPGEA